MRWRSWSAASRCSGDGDQNARRATLESVAHVLRSSIAALLAPLSIVVAAAVAEAAHAPHRAGPGGETSAWALYEPGDGAQQGAEADRQDGESTAEAGDETYGITSEALLWTIGVIFGLVALGTLLVGLVAHRRRAAGRRE